MQMYVLHPFLSIYTFEREVSNNSPDIFSEIKKFPNIKSCFKERRMLFSLFLSHKSILSWPDFQKSLSDASEESFVYIESKWCDFFYNRAILIIFVNITIDWL